MAEEKVRDTRTTMRIVAGLVLFALLIAFVVDNTDDVEVGFVFGDAGVPMIFVLVVTAIIGALLDRIATWVRRR